MADKPTIAFVETSLTDGSFEADLAKEIMNIVGDRAEAITIGYEDLPLAGEAPEYPLPEAALAVRDKLGNADAVWVVVSEYKKEIPDSLRNLFDWLSLPSTKDEEGKNVLGGRWHAPLPGRGRPVRSGRGCSDRRLGDDRCRSRGAAHAG